MYWLNFYAVPHLICPVFLLILGIFVYNRNRSASINFSFLLVTLSATVWLLGTALVLLSVTEDLALFWCKICQAGISFIPVTIHHFTVSFTQVKRQKIVVIVNYLIGAFFFVPLLFTDTVVAGTYDYSWGYWLKAGPLHKLFLVFFAVLMSLSILNLFSSYRKEKFSLERMRKRFVLLAFGIAYIGTIDYLPDYGFKIYPFGYLPVVAWLSIIAYAIAKHRLMDIGLVIRRGVTYSLSVGMITTGFIAAVLVIVRLFGEYAGYTALPLVAIAALIVAFAFYPLKNRIQKMVDKWFYKGAYDYHEVLSNASKAMTSILDFEKLLSYILTVVSDSMKIEQNWILLRSAGARRYEVRLAAAFDERYKCPMVPPLPANNILMTYLRTDREPIVREEMERMLPPGEAESLSNEMKRFNADVAVPIMLKDKLMGAVLLGPKLSGDIYSGEDLQLLSTLTNQAASAIRNAQLYTRLQKDLDTIRYLEREKAKAERLASLGTMAAGIAHEIKNPLVSIKTFAQLLPERASDPEFRDEFSKIAVKEIDRIDSLVLGLLSLAKPSPPNFEAVSVNSMLDETLTPIHLRLDEKGIQLKKEYQEGLPEVMGDSLQLKQVFSNIIINGIQATSRGGTITVITSWRRDSRNRNGYVEIRVRDTGIGIPQEELGKIFDPFYTTKHEGVGLGLPICHRIIKDHQGDIRLESKKDVGTTCIISVPAIDTDPSRRESDDGV